MYTLTSIEAVTRVVVRSESACVDLTRLVIQCIERAVTP